MRSGIATGKAVSGGATAIRQRGQDVETVYPVLEVLAETGAPLLVHGEVTDPDIVFDREAVFIDRILQPCMSVCRS